MPTNYKLTYLNARGRAENTRMMLALAAQNYEDVRYELEDFPMYKNTTPFGQVPVLHVDGVDICQSKAIDMMVAQEFGFAGTNLAETTRVDMLNHCVQDCVDIMLNISKVSDATKREDMIKTFRNEQFPEYLKKMTALFEANASHSGFFVGSSITLADISFVNGLDWPPLLGVAVDLKPYPKLKELKKSVTTNPRIKAWIAKRPETGF